MHLSVRTCLQIASFVLVFILGYTVVANGYFRLTGTQQSTRTFNVIHKVATGQVSQTLSGHMFDAKDRYQLVQQEVSTGVVHWFSPYIEKETAEKFIGPPFEHSYYGNQVALCFHDDRLIMVARVWLAKYKMWIGSEGRYLGYKAPPVRNNFNDNWLYYQHFDKNMIPISYSSLLGVPAPSQYKYGDGPTDPRLFVYRDRPYLLFNMDMALNETHDINYPIIWDFLLKGPIWIDINGGSLFWNNSKSQYMEDRHWSPLVIGGNDLYFVYNLDPLNILRCSIASTSCACSFVDLPGSTFKFNKDSSHVLRGGTPFIHFKGSYHISFAYSVMSNVHGTDTVYSIHLVAISTEPVFRLIYVSQGFEVPSEIYKVASAIVSERFSAKGFVVPVALLQEESGTQLLSVNVNDHASVLLRVNGLEGLMMKVMRQDLYKKPLSGPITDAVQDYISLSLKTNSPESNS